MRLIDPNVLKQQDFQDFSNTDVFYAIDNCPIIDAVPVVRCKDCIYYEPELGTDLGWCPVCSFVRRDDDFCSYGERKENDA